jgi:glycerol kinase
MQLQADLLERTVVRGQLAEVSAIGAAAMAAEGLRRPLKPNPAPAATFAPRMSGAAREALRNRWREAVRRATWPDTASTSKAPGHTDRIKGEFV